MVVAMALEDTAAALVTRIEVTDPRGRHFVTDMSPEVAEYTYAAYLGYVTRQVRGYDSPEGGFCIVERGRP